MKIRDIKYPLVRLLILVAIGIPCLSYWPLTLIDDNLNSFSFIGSWVLYMLLLHVIILQNAGSKQWSVWFAAACVLALVTVGTALVMLNLLDQVGLLKMLQHASATSQPIESAPYTKTIWCWEHLRKGLMIITVVPFAIFVIQSFSVTSGIERAAQWAGRRARYTAHVLMVLRVLQHVAEILPPMITVWKEEHPDVFKPRFRQDVRGAVGRIGDIITWIFTSVFLWTRTTLVFALEPVPMFCWTIESQVSRNRMLVEADTDRR
jgi:hypothetical protein